MAGESEYEHYFELEDVGFLFNEPDGAE